MRPSVDRLAKLSGPLNQEFRVRWRNGEVRWLRGAEKKKKKGSAWAISALKNQAILWVGTFPKPNPDGSVDIYIQRHPPGSNLESNWLPAAEGKFNLMLRFYWPKQSLLDGSWKIPPVKQTD